MVCSAFDKINSEISNGKLANGVVTVSVCVVTEGNTIVVHADDVRQSLRNDVSLGHNVQKYKSD
jgi:hypothetical protein